ncbi:hypothetical protein Pcac1_g19182 [Phytophthora cactorum]|nr:hypothetical protein Pcac1_g19182 [Phytophthora cactorum]KAG3036104.1 hypothetical protein PC119_g4317 [Phytophthora cactorum]KAG3198711.1 hypothetical protein PC128_g5846 [Phytophthora cactorum]
MTTPCLRLPEKRSAGGNPQENRSQTSDGMQYRIGPNAPFLNIQVKGSAF